MKVVFDRDWKICNPGKWDGVWELKSQNEICSVVHQEGRGEFVVANSIIRSIG